MVRAGVVEHPAQWEHGGYRESKLRPSDNTLIDLRQLSTMCGFGKIEAFQGAHRQWIEHAIRGETLKRDARWSEALRSSTPFFSV